MKIGPARCARQLISSVDAYNSKSSCPPCLCVEGTTVACHDALPHHAIDNRIESGIDALPVLIALDQDAAHDANLSRADGKVGRGRAEDERDCGKVDPARKF